MSSLSDPPGNSEGEGESSRSNRQQYNRYLRIDMGDGFTLCNMKEEPHVS